MQTADFVPSFFAVGPPRTGTTWLHARLEQEVSLPGVKETRFFDRNFEKGWGWYRAQFDSGHAHDMAGEIAPTYFYETKRYFLSLIMVHIAADMPLCECLQLVP